MPFELSWRPGGSVGYLIDLFGFFELTMVVVRGREVDWENAVLDSIKLKSSSNHLLNKLAKRVK